MNDPDKLDFSPLGPSQSEARWQRLVAQTARRARERQARRAETISGQLVAWSRPALALAASFSLLVWSASWWRQSLTAQRTEAAVQTEQAAFLLHWALSDEVPPVEVLLQVAGAGNGGR